MNGELIKTLVMANHILVQKGVLDSFGHISVRNPENTQRYFMSRSLAPRSVTADDILEYTLDNEPVAKTGVRHFLERPIHGCLYEARPDVMAICHNHDYGLLPFAITKRPLRPAIHMASVIGDEVQTWDIRDEFGETSLLVTTKDMGASLAKFLGKRPATLMRGHGSVVVGGSIPEMALIGYYLQVNAQIVLQSKNLGEVQYLSDEEIKLSAPLILAPAGRDRLWADWAQQASSQP